MIDHVVLNEADAEWLEDVVFPGGPVIASMHGAIGPALRSYDDSLANLISKRYHSAVSGAMRWTWSQEMPLVLKVTVSDNL